MDGLVLTNIQSSFPHTHIFGVMDLHLTQFLSTYVLGTYSVTVMDNVGCTTDTTFTIGQVIVYGCTGSISTNYDPNATQDDGSCQYLATCGNITGIFVDNIIHDRACI